MLSSGAFSKVSGLSIKALRLYHEAGILVPKLVDRDTGYRYYDFDNVERARVIVILRDMMFSVDDIKRLLSGCKDDGDALAFLEAQKTEVEAKIRQLKLAKAALDKIVENERKALDLVRSETFRIEEKVLPDQLVAAIRMRGDYMQLGSVFSTLGRKAGRVAMGRPFGLFYDDEFKDGDADFAGVFAIKREISADGIDVYQLRGGKAVTLLCQGPYELVGRTYARIFEYIEKKGHKALVPSREVFLKGPGLLFKGNPQNYLTEIQVLFEN